jgi:hypothetical protein
MKLGLLKGLPRHSVDADTFQFPRGKRGACKSRTISVDIIEKHASFDLLQKDDKLEKTKASHLAQLTEAPCFLTLTAIPKPHSSRSRAAMIRLADFALPVFVKSDLGTIWADSERMCFSIDSKQTRATTSLLQRKKKESYLSL